jgi:hypothetical protein
MIRLDCSERSCGAKHYPDTVTIKQDCGRLAIYDNDCQYMKIGRSVYASRKFASAYTELLETSYVSTAAYAASYASACTEDENVSLQAEHVWKAFVLHATLQLAEESGEPFITQQGAPSEEIVASALHNYLDNVMFPAAMDHRCPECARYERRWRSGAIEAGKLKALDDGVAADMLPSRNIKVCMHYCPLTSVSTEGEPCRITRKIHG